MLFLDLYHRRLMLGACLLMMGVSAQPTQGQQYTPPFSTVDVRFSGTTNLNRNFLHQFWKPGVGADFSLGTPFHLGFFEIGGSFHRYEAEQPVPGFGALWLYAGWGMGFDVANRLRLEASGRIGNYQMSFDEENQFAGVANESELAMMLNTRLAVRAIGPVSFFVSGSYMKVYTFLRLKLWYASAGLSYRFRSTSWLKDVLE